jgi:hypothetical protein
MRVATIVPEKFLQLTVNEKFFMALAHLIDGENAYSHFFRQRSEEGAFILMDNGAAEHAQLDTIEDILEVAARINPTEVVLPDVLMSKDGTLEKTQTALKWLKDNDRIGDYLWMAVPQGRDLIHWQYCLRNLLDIDKDDLNINSIGISKFLTLQLGVDAREKALNVAMDLLHEYDRYDIDIHLLGCGYDPLEVATLNKKFAGRIRSVDSAIPYVYAQKGLEMRSDIDRPQFEIEFLGEHEIDLDLLAHNIDQWRGLADEQL